MRFLGTTLAGAYLIEPELLEDDRGFFARLLDRDEFARHGLVVPSTQWSISFNRRRGTLRGLHYQQPPHDEIKLVRCTAGAIFDVIVDLKSGRWFGAELSAANRRSLYVPAGFAHGFETLTGDAEVSYAIDGNHDPDSARGVRWDDPAFAIEWPLTPTMMADRDRGYPDWKGE
jgi:dTDP-4-dehydrorhamnose 3,5-epimerase